MECQGNLVRTNPLKSGVEVHGFRSAGCNLRALKSLRKTVASLGVNLANMRSSKGFWQVLVGLLL